MPELAAPFPEPAGCYALILVAPSPEVVTYSRVIPDRARGYGGHGSVGRCHGRTGSRIGPRIISEQAGRKARPRLTHVLAPCGPAPLQHAWLGLEAIAAAVPHARRPTSCEARAALDSSACGPIPQRGLLPRATLALTAESACGGNHPRKGDIPSCPTGTASRRPRRHPPFTAPVTGQARPSRRRGRAGSPG